MPQRLVRETLLRYDPGQQLPKKIHELLVGYLFVQFFGDGQRKSATIGFPAAQDWQQHCPKGDLSLDLLLEHPTDFVRDGDADIHISAGGFRRKFQVTRFVYPRGQEPHRRLAELIEVNCLTSQNDRSLDLLVSIEKTPNISVDELCRLCRKTAIPFGAIYLIGKASSEQGHVYYRRLYPKPIVGKETRVSLPI